MMGEPKAKWVQFAITTLIGICWNAFDRWAQLQPILTSWVSGISPIVYVVVGISFGYAAMKAANKREVDERDKEIERLERMYSELAREVRANTDEVNKVLARELRGLELKDGE